MGGIHAWRMPTAEATLAVVVVVVVLVGRSVPNGSLDESVSTAGSCKVRQSNISAKLFPSSLGTAGHGIMYTCGPKAPGCPSSTRSSS